MKITCRWNIKFCGKKIASLLYGNVLKIKMQTDLKHYNNFTKALKLKTVFDKNNIKKKSRFKVIIKKVSLSCLILIKFGSIAGILIKPYLITFSWKDFRAGKP